MRPSLPQRVEAFLLPGFMRKLGLRSRFMVMAALAIFAFGLANLVVFEAVAANVIRVEVHERAVTLSQHLATDAAHFVLLGDQAGLRRLLDAARRDDPLCDYALVLGRDGTVIASTFGDALPEGLAAANSGTAVLGRTVLLSDRGTVYGDVAAAMLEGELGTVRIGARMDRIHSGVAEIRRAVIAMVTMFLLVGLAGSWFTAHLIASPVERLAAMARTFDPAEPAGPPGSRHPHPGEVGDLVRSFELMGNRLRQIHKDRQAFQDRIVRAERLATVGALAAGVAHEINNPLAGLRNCLQAVAREPEDLEQTRTYARMMIEATRSIERTVRSLIDVAARTRPDPSRVDVGGLLDRTVVLMRHRFATDVVRLDIRVSERLPSIRTDEGLLQQVLVNLLINACDASPVGAAVTLSASIEGERVVFGVADRGSGIAAEVVDRMFQPFVTTKADRGGTGLGLAMVRSLVDDLGGEVTFETSASDGTFFRVVLPMTGPDRTEEAELESARVAGLRVGTPLLPD